MPECKVCGGNEFGEEDGLFICIECHTVNEDLRVEVHDYRDPEELQSHALSQQVFSQVMKTKIKKEDGVNIKILTSWEAFNLCLKGLVDQLKELGATPRLEAVVFKLWIDYLQKTEAAFFSKKHKVPPRLPVDHWNSDAFLVYNVKKKKTLVLQSQKRKRTPAKQRSKVQDEEPLEGDSTDGECTPRKVSSNRKNFIKGDYFKNQYATHSLGESLSVTDATVLSSLRMEPVKNNVSRPIQLVTKEDLPRVPALKRKHLLAFLYLGCQITQQPIQLSDILRWIDEGHLYYHKLSNFFPPSLEVLSDLKVYFLEEKTVPTYRMVTRASYEIARLLYIRVLPLPDMKSFIHRFCDEFNLPNQVALVSKRLMRLLPPHVHDVNKFQTIVSWESRAMAHLIVAIKIILGLDDTTEHQNSKIATQINEVLSREGSSIDLFVWDDWVRWSKLRSFVLALYGKITSKPAPNMGLCQNIEEMVSFWQSFKPCYVQGELRLKRETETMAEVLAKLSEERYASSWQAAHFPPSLTPLATYTDTVVMCLKTNKMPTKGDEAWNTLVENVDLEVLLQDFRCKGIEYLLHPEKLIDWVQQKGLPVGFRFGAGIQKCRQTTKAQVTSYGKACIRECRVLLTDREKKKFKESKTVRAGSRSVCRAAKTRPDNTVNGPLEPLTEMTDAVPQVCYGKGKSVSFTAPPAMSLVEAQDADKFLCIPSTEYWTHLDSEDERPTSFNYLVSIAAKYLYTSEKALLEEVALVESLHAEFLRLNRSKPSRKKEW